MELPPGRFCISLMLQPSPLLIFAAGLSPLLLTTPALAFQHGGEASVILQLDGGQSGERLGESLAMMGDLDLDGTPELAVGMPYASTNGFLFNGAVDIRSGATGLSLFRFDGTADFQNFGLVLASRQDVDGDGFDDLLIGSPDASPSALVDAGMFHLYSGATGLLLWQQNGALAGDHLGAGAALLGDLNSDGKSEFLVGAPGANAANGEVHLYDGATGASLQTFLGSAGEEFGAALAATGDIDQDGTNDFLIGAPLASTGGMTENGRAEIFSGATFLSLRQHVGNSTSDRFGSALSGNQHLNLDSTLDYLIGAPNASVFAPSAGAGIAFSGLNGAVLFRLDGQMLADNLGASVALCGDVNGDGYGDALIGGRLIDANGLADSGSAFLLNGRNGALIFRADGAATLDNLGRSVDGGLDYDGDGHPDFVHAAPFADPGGLSLAGTLMLQGIVPALQSTAPTLNASFGGSVDFLIDFPLSEAGKDYILLASRSGVGPTSYQSVSIPLAFDNLFLRMTVAPPPVFSGSGGTLDSLGDGSANLSVGPGTAAGLIGQTIHFAVLSLEPGLMPSIASNQVSLIILP